MFYSYAATRTGAGASTAFTDLDLDLSAGVIHQVDFIFPSDSDKSLYAQIWRGGHQIWPSNRGESIRGDNMVISFREFFVLTGARNNLTLKAKNVASSGDLTLLVNIGILPGDVLQPFSIKTLLAALGK